MNSKTKISRGKKTGKRMHQASVSRKTAAARIKQNRTPYRKIEINKEFRKALDLKRSDEKSRRIIEPLHVGELSYEGRPFLDLEAFCHSRKEQRNFRVDRILEMRTVKE